jgi:hypothetical protein
LREKTHGHLALRVTDDPLAYGAAAFERSKAPSEARIVIQHYSFKKKEAVEPNPVFVLQPSDLKWYTDFREELENLWVAAIQWRET